jgi:hypothetical protein
MYDVVEELDRIAFPSIWARKHNFVADEWQAGLLDSDARQIIVNCSRQVGKSTTTAVKVAHRGLYTPGALILLLAPSERQSVELMHKAKEFIESEGVGVTRLTQTQAEFDNGSRIFALPGKEATVRGYSGADLVVIDEASRVPDDLYYTIRPMLAVGNGQVILLSTPWGKRGFFHDIWMGDNPEGWQWPWESKISDAWQRYSVPATGCPRITDEFLEQERLKMPSWFFAQEYMCQFAETQDSVFNYDDIISMFDDGVQSVKDAGEESFTFDSSLKSMKF